MKKLTLIILLMCFCTTAYGFDGGYDPVGIVTGDDAVLGEVTATRVNVSGNGPSYISFENNGATENVTPSFAYYFQNDEPAVNIYGLKVPLSTRPGFYSGTTGEDLNTSFFVDAFSGYTLSSPTITANITTTSQLWFNKASQAGAQIISPSLTSNNKLVIYADEGQAVGETSSIFYCKALSNTFSVLTKPLIGITATARIRGELETPAKNGSQFIFGVFETDEFSITNVNKNYIGIQALASFGLKSTNGKSRNGSTTTLTSTELDASVLNDNVWYEIKVGVNKTNPFIYINGVQVYDETDSTVDTFSSWANYVVGFYFTHKTTTQQKYEIDIIQIEYREY